MNRFPLIHSSISSDKKCYEPIPASSHKPLRALIQTSAGLQHCRVVIKSWHADSAGTHTPTVTLHSHLILQNSIVRWYSQRGELFPASPDRPVQLRYRLNGGGGRRIETPSRRSALKPWPVDDKLRFTIEWGWLWRVRYQRPINYRLYKPSWETSCHSQSFREQFDNTTNRTPPTKPTPFTSTITPTTPTMK